MASCSVCKNNVRARRQAAFVGGSKSSREQKFQGANDLGSEKCSSLQNNIDKFTIIRKKTAQQLLFVYQQATATPSQVPYDLKRVDTALCQPLVLHWILFETPQALAVRVTEGSEIDIL